MERRTKENIKERFSPKGRIRRLYYFKESLTVSIITTFFVFLSFMILSLIFDRIFEKEDPNQTLSILEITVGGIFMLVPIGVLIGGSIAVLMLTTKRLHDLGYSGELSLFILIPILGEFLYLILLFAPGKEGPNEYGDPSS